MNNKRIKDRDVQNEKLCKAIDIFAENTKESFTWRDIKDHLMNNLGAWIDMEIIKKILKNKLRYSFRRCSARPLTLNYQNTLMKKTSYAVKLLKVISKDTIMINADECIFSKTTKINYSWSKTGVASNLSTEKIKGSIGIVSSIASNGVSITGIKKGTITSKSFIEYIENLTIIWRRL